MERKAAITKDVDDNKAVRYCSEQKTILRLILDEKDAKMIQYCYRMKINDFWYYEERGKGYAEDIDCRG